MTAARSTILAPPAPLRLDEASFRLLLQHSGPSLALWRAAEVAALREQHLETPIVDLGCGDGLSTSLVLQNVDVGIDADPAALERAKAHKIYARLESCEAQDLDLPRASVGTILSNSKFQQVPRVEALLQWAAGVLRPGGRLIFTVPGDGFNACLFRSSPDYVARRNEQLGHLNLWPIEVWGGMLAGAGMRLVQTRHYLTPRQVRLWDALDVAQQPRIAGRSAFGMLWRSLPSLVLDRLAARASTIDLAAPAPGGGLLIVAQKR